MFILIELNVQIFYVNKQDCISILHDFNFYCPKQGNGTKLYILL